MASPEAAEWKKAIYSPVSSLNSVRDYLALNCQRGYAIRQLAVETAFLNGLRDENVWIMIVKLVRFIFASLSSFNVLLKGLVKRSPYPAKKPNVYGQKFDEFIDGERFDSKRFRELVGSLLYIASGTRPDIVSRFASSPSILKLQRKLI
ncbi:hypothetical protein PsorP6_001961 [Peronosclerospora sorghi]|uniref:Uncharacterized protein n=1 Tax=Peronosclerospora sorghi TaxID=230839 RepID=A0ACC0WQI6_9STRA|nr:hypothetical protein PsorP6_001961 [Peronosclerospora sorghi]